MRISAIISSVIKRTRFSFSRKFKIASITVLATLLIGIFILNFKNPQTELAYKVEAVAPVSDKHFSNMLGNLMGPEFVGGNRVHALYNGDEIFPAMLDAIKVAKKTITFESYIYWSGGVGSQFADALSERARNGVKVHVLIDWVGSQKMDQSLVERMEAAGIQLEYYHRLKWYNLSRMNFRTHRKILVVDGRIGFTGGVGIADEWSGDGLHPNHWRDSHYRAEGPVVGQMQSAFMDNWMKSRPEVLHSPDYFPETKKVGNSSAQMFKSSSREGGSSVRIMYLLAIAAAKKSIHIESAYFVPDETTIDALVNARRRGVDVELIVPGVLTDSLIVRHASRQQWGPLLEAGVRIFEYQPALFHCKVFVVDKLFVSIGSTNFDERSFRLNDEANLNILDGDFALRELEAFSRDREKSVEVSLEAWKNRPFFDKVTEQMMIIFRSQF